MVYVRWVGRYLVYCRWLLSKTGSPKYQKKDTGTTWMHQNLDRDPRTLTRFCPIQAIIPVVYPLLLQPYTAPTCQPLSTQLIFLSTPSVVSRLAL